MRAILLSAGFGKRLRPYTEKLAKPAVAFLKLPMIAYPLLLAEKAGVKSAVLNTHHLPETLKKAAQSLNSKIDLQFLHESPQILDSGGGIKNAESILSKDDNFWALNGDTVLLLPSFDIFSQAMKQHIASGAIATVFVTHFPKDSKALGGVYTKDNSNNIFQFSKQNIEGEFQKYHYVGVGLYSRKIFDYLPEGEPSNIFYDGLTAAIADGQVAQIYELDKALWLETGNPEDHQRATIECLKELQKGSQSPYSLHLKELQHRFQTQWDQAINSHSSLEELASRFALN